LLDKVGAREGILVEIKRSGVWEEKNPKQPLTTYTWEGIKTSQQNSSSWGTAFDLGTSGDGEKTSKKLPQISLNVRARGVSVRKATEKKKEGCKALKW